jgi:hypothetical protein
MELGQGGLVLKEVDLRRRARHVEINDRFGLGWDSKSFCLCSVAIARQQVVQGDGAKSQSGLTEEVTPGDRLSVSQVE